MTEKEVIQEAADFVYEAITCLHEVRSEQAAELKRKLQSIMTDLENMAK